MGNREQAVTVLGAGSWGTALAILLSSEGQPVRLWGHLQAEIDSLLKSKPQQIIHMTYLGEHNCCCVICAKTDHSGIDFVFIADR